jgi:hypothetical protein
MAKYLAVSWLAAAVPYVGDVEALPEPIVAAVVATAVGIAASVIAGVRDRQPVAVARVSSAQRPERRQPPRLSARPAARPSLDLASYGRAHPAEAQCPHCGHLFVAEHIATCRVCSTTWDPSSSAPDVVVRSWLHR